MLAGLAQKPSADDPLSNPGGALVRRNQVLERMLAGVSTRRYRRVQEPVGPYQLLPQPPVEVSVAGEAHGGAQVAVPGAALLAALAGDRGIDRHSAACVRAVERDPGELVTGHDRLPDRGIADAALEEPVQVRAADPDRGDCHPRPAGLWRRLGRLVLQPEVARSVQPGGQHGQASEGASTSTKASW